MVKNTPSNVGDVRDTGSIPGSGRSPEVKMATHSSILAERIPWTEEPGGLQSVGLHVDYSPWGHTWAAVRGVTRGLSAHAHTHLEDNGSVNSEKVL